MNSGELSSSAGFGAIYGPLRVECRAIGMENPENTRCPWISLLWYRHGASDLERAGQVLAPKSVIIRVLGAVGWIDIGFDRHESIEKKCCKPIDRDSIVKRKFARFFIFRSIHAYRNDTHRMKRALDCNFWYFSLLANYEHESIILPPIKVMKVSISWVHFYWRGISVYVSLLNLFLRFLLFFKIQSITVWTFMIISELRHLW